MSQLKELARRFPRSLVKKAPQGKYGDYVPHSIVNERLLEVLGPFTFELVEVVRGFAPEIATKKQTFPERANAIVGVVARMTVEIDGRPVAVEEVGTEDNPAMKNDAENLKNSMSDALKRCAMRFGLGLHLWSQGDYYLDRSLAKGDEPLEPATPHSDSEAPEPEAPSEAPAKREKTLGPAKAADLGKALDARGVEKPLEFARLATGRDELATLADLTIPESKAVFAMADGQPEEVPA